MKQYTVVLVCHGQMFYVDHNASNTKDAAHAIRFTDLNAAYLQCHKWNKAIFTSDSSFHAVQEWS